MSDGILKMLVYEQIVITLWKNDVVMAHIIVSKPKGQW